MIKDILVNLSYGTSQDGVANCALSVAETFGAHIVGIAFSYPVMAGGIGLPTNFSRAQQAEAQERAESVAAAFDVAARRAGVSAETRRWQPRSRASGRRCHAVSYSLRQGEYCCCGHSEREK